MIFIPEKIQAKWHANKIFYVTYFGKTLNDSNESDSSLIDVPMYQLATGSLLTGGTKISRIHIYVETD